VDVKAPAPVPQPGTRAAFDWRERLGHIIDHAMHIRSEGVRKAVVDLLYEFDALPDAPAPASAPPLDAQRLDAVVTAFEALTAAGYTLHGSSGPLTKQCFIDAIVLALNAVAPPRETQAPPAEDGYHKGIYKSRCCSTLKANPYTFDSCPACGRNLGWERAIAPAPPAEKEKP